MHDEPMHSAQLEELRRSLSMPPENLPLADLVPVFVPASFFESGNWPGPYVLLRAKPLAVTWAILRPQNTMLYVSKDAADYWERKHLPWREQAMENLVRLSENTLTSHHFSRTDGTAYALVMMHDDGVGPSRLLLNGHIKDIFPEGYSVAIPERSVGIALRRGASETEQLKIQELVKKCFNEGTAPVSPSMFDPEEIVVDSS